MFCFCLCFARICFVFGLYDIFDSSVFCLISGGLLWFVCMYVCWHLFCVVFLTPALILFDFLGEEFALVCLFVCVCFV